MLRSTGVPWSARSRKQPRKRTITMTPTQSERKEQRQFTMLELLIVIGIMMILMSLAVPGFRRLVSGKAVNAAASMLSGQLALARAAAIAEQRYIAVIMPGAHFKAPDSAADSGTTYDEYHFRSFRIGIVEKGAAANQFKLVSWYPDSKWTFLPVGAILAECNETGVADSASNDIELFGPRGDRKVNLNWMSDGQLDGDTSSNSCYVIDGGTENEKKLVPGKTHDAYNASARCVVFSPKGRCCSTDGTDTIFVNRYITLVEGNVAEHGSADYRAEEAEIANMRVLRLNGMTGRCEFVKIVGAETPSGGGGGGGNPGGGSGGGDTGGGSSGGNTNP